MKNHLSNILNVNDFDQVVNAMNKNELKVIKIFNQKMNMCSEISRIKTDIDERFEQIKPLFGGDPEFYLEELDYLKDYYTLVYSDDMYPNVQNEHKNQEFKEIILFVKNYINQLKSLLIDQ